jgi:uncharacterized damage-inducible protein DinB
MRVKDLQELYEYGDWANKRLFQVIARLTPDEFTRSVAGSYGSIRNTMVHVMSAEWGWLERCGGTARGPRLNPDDYPTVESVVTQWANVERYIREFFAGLADADLDRPIEYAIGDSEKSVMALGELMHHGAIHAVHHRGQVALLLRLLGLTPGNFDILFYYGERRGVPA